jgi:hypothetical protein
MHAVKILCMKKLTFLSLWLTLFTGASVAQVFPLLQEPDGGNLKASVSEQIGIVNISIQYSRPGVKGREGKIYGTNVAHYGFKDLGHGTSHAAPWRAGANENTVFTFSHPVSIEGRLLPAGKYGFFIALEENESTLIFSKRSSSWGSFYYDSTQDALRVKVKNKTLDKSEEWLKYEFINETNGSATVAMRWEKRMIAFTIAADVKKLQLESFKNDLSTTRPYYDFVNAVNYCIEKDTALNQALEWIDRAIYFRVMGVKNFLTLSTKAALHRKMNRLEEAKKIMDTALPYGNMVEIHQYARLLLAAKEIQEAVKIFRYNYNKNPHAFTTLVGMGRAYAALGEYKKAQQMMNEALPLAPDELNKSNIQNMLLKLKEGKDVN